MTITCRVELEYEEEKKLENILKSVEVDNYDYVSCFKQGKKLVAVIKSHSIPSLIHTLDDYLACVSLAEKIVETGMKKN